mmetsp:Transcript_8653/g.8791  ORF Transcript_8653/g.8791 Transcript_8653/m.8791 type:complete len:151 (+) Transcript_8653:141-593(+)
MELPEEDDFAPISNFPTGRLKDIVAALDTNRVSVLNLDACIPRGNIAIFRTILYKIEIAGTVKTLSMRFNSLGDIEAQILTEWLMNNDTIEKLYLLCSGIQIPQRNAIEEAWKRNLRGHHYENNGYTFIRVPLEDPHQAAASDPATSMKE